MEQTEVTKLLCRVGGGDRAAFEQLLPMVYTELRKLARGYMSRERSDHTLQPTALVHEAYLKLVGGASVDWQNRAHFFAVAAQQMRRILVDHARRVHAGRHGGGVVKVSLDDVNNLPGRRDEDVAAIDEALARLEKVDPRAARVVELRFFAGLTDQEAAHVLGVSVPMARRDWKFAQAWLFNQLRGI